MNFNYTLKYTPEQKKPNTKEYIKIAKTNLIYKFRTVIIPMEKGGSDWKGATRGVSRVLFLLLGEFSL